MSKSLTTLSAGNAGSSRFIALNTNQGGGTKKQGISPFIGRISGINYNRSYGNNRDVIFYINQLGGVGRKRSMFISSGDGVRPQPPCGPNEYEWIYCGYPSYFSRITSSLIPSIAPSPDKINQPIGSVKARALATSLGITNDLIYTTEEYNCFMEDTDDKDIFYTCLFNLTNTCNSKATYEELGLYDIFINAGLTILTSSKSLASYGLSVYTQNDTLLISSDCQDDSNELRSCKEFNKLMAGSLEKTAAQCGNLEKLLKILALGSRLNASSVACQNSVESSCLDLQICRRTNHIKYFGVPITPVLFAANFILIYCLNPELGALMPGYIQNIPYEIAKKLLKDGSIDYEQYINDFVTCSDSV